MLALGTVCAYPVRVATTRKFDKRAIAYIALIVIGSAIAVLGINLLILNSTSTEVRALVTACESDTSCLVAYELDGESLESSLERPSGGLAEGDSVDVAVLEGSTDQVFTPDQVSMGFAATVLAIALMVVIFGSVRLYIHWRRQLVENLASEGTSSKDGKPGQSNQVGEK